MNGISPDDVLHAAGATKITAFGKPSTVPAETIIVDPKAPLSIARALIAHHYHKEGCRTLLHQGGAFYAWTGTHYTECLLEEIRAAAYDFLDRAVCRDGEGVKPFNPNRARVGNVCEALAAVAQLPSSTQPPQWLGDYSGPDPADLLICKNGVVHLPTRALMPHNPALFALNALSFAFNPTASSPMNWLKFLAEIWPDDQPSIDTLQEMFGLALTGDTRHQKAFLLIGPKRSGKGTIARVLTALVGQDNTAGPTLSSLGQNFGLAPLIGRRLAIVSDARLSGRADQQVIVERLLAITGEDNLTIDRKFRDPWTGRLPVRFFILSNELPRLSDASGAMASRFITLVLKHSFFGREDHGLTDHLLHELPSILLWALAGFDRLRSRGHFVPPPSALEAQRELEDLGSPIGAFLRERGTVEPSATVRCEALYEAWCTWCRDQGRDHPGTIQSFSRDLRACVAGLRIAQPRTDDGSRSRYFQGVGLT